MYSCSKKIFVFLFFLVLLFAAVHPAQANSSNISVRGGFIDFVTPAKQHVMGGLIEADYEYLFSVKPIFSVGLGGSFIGGLITRPYLSLNLLLFYFEFTLPLVFHVSKKVDLHFRLGSGLAFHLLVKATSQFENNTLLTAGSMWRTLFGITIKINNQIGLTGESGYVGAYNSYQTDTSTLKEGYMLTHGFQINAGIKFYVD